ncbi:MAG: PAS domain S-box protein [Neomegalonema sp.]|nr:PAS domain S-box protein [Neomegalonema sp.]
MDEREAFEDTLFEAAPVGLVLTEYRIIKACNSTFCEMTGYERDELIGQSFKLFYENDDEFARVRSVFESAVKVRGVDTKTRLLKRRDGDFTWCQFRAKTLTPREPIARAVLAYVELHDPPGAIDLTDREKEVLLRLGMGAVSREIAADLNLSPRTIDDVRSRLLKKFGVKSTAEVLKIVRDVEGYDIVDLNRIKQPPQADDS